jgi:4-amino-4-deoxy-L-arabinose transferase-like glycosyltransferase
MTNPRGTSISPLTSRLVAAALLALLAALLFTSARQESQVFDESDHLYAGYEYWKHGDFGTNPEHPPLVKMLATIPLLSMGLKEPPPFPAPFFKIGDFVNGAQFLYGGGDADGLLMRGRAVVALFSLALAVLVYLAAGEVFGPLAGLLALGLFVFEPVMLSNGALVTTDMPLACLFFASTYAFYRFLKKPTLWRLSLCAAAAALTMASKHSGALVLPTLALLGLADYLAHRITFGLLPEEGNRLRTLNLLQLTGALAAIGLVSYGFLWTVYGFRYAARPGQLVLIPALADYATQLSPAKQGVILFFARHHLFPEAYLYGWTDILQIAGTRATYIFGHLYPDGQWFFFPGVFVVKSTLALMILLVLVPFAGVSGRRREFLFFTIPAGFFMAVSVGSMLSLGVRHILPVYPFCLVLAGAAAAVLAARSVAGRVAVGALLAFTVVSSLHSFPDFLAYSNEAFGGPANTWRVLTDSNDDWGQGLKWTKTYMDRHPDGDCWFDYSDPLIDPAYYGIRCKPLPSAMGLLFGLNRASVPTTISGTVYISAMEASGLMWGPDSLNPYRSIVDRRPDAEIGNVILVYRGDFDVTQLAALSAAGNAVSLMRMHRMPEALAAAQAAVQLAPNSAQVNAALGWALLASGRGAEGQQTLATALHLAQTDHPEYQKYLIFMLAEQSRGGGAAH